MRASSCASRPAQERAARFAIRPYPVELETEIVHRDGKNGCFIRPIRPDDEPLLQAFTRRLTPEDMRMRFFGPLRELSHEMAARLTQIDYDREMAFLLLDGKELLGVGRLAADPGFEQAEFALIVASDRQGAATARCCSSTCCTTPRRAASSAWSATCCARTTRCSSSPSGWASGAKAAAPASPTFVW